MFAAAKPIAKSPDESHSKVPALSAPHYSANVNTQNRTRSENSILCVQNRSSDATCARLCESSAPLPETSGSARFGSVGRWSAAHKALEHERPIERRKPIDTPYSCDIDLKCGAVFWRIENRALRFVFIVCCVRRRCRSSIVRGEVAKEGRIGRLRSRSNRSRSAYRFLIHFYRKERDHCRTRPIVLAGNFPI